MANTFLEARDQFRQGLRSLLWIDYWDYATGLFGLPHPSDTAGMIRVIQQGHDLLHTDIVLVRGAYQWAPAPTDREPPLRQLRQQLKQLADQGHLATVLTGLTTLWGNSVPVFVSLPAPQKLLQDIQTTGTETEVERAAMYQADFLRTLMPCHIAGVVLEADEEPNSWESCQPIWNLADHYGWAKGVELAARKVPILDPQRVGLDFLLLPDCALDQLSALWKLGIDVAGGLTKEFWETDQPLPSPSRRWGYGKIPATVRPETVLDKLQQWCHRS